MNVQDLGVRALDCFRANKEFRIKFGRAMDMILTGESAEAVMRRELPRLDGEIRTRGGLSWEESIYVAGFPNQWITLGRFNLLRNKLFT